ncbi:hypothetical protein NBRC111893_1288 [Lentilactobacillus kosonis]|uniref:Uncharacterized protein n=1 Tax=Lentilactobacillus kosonis TaxID=2810561 RepID=A0A401FL83_9LACO|nr:hypothetical protein NBRC111893_1288 [Lentilactobacillus kosonis]
MDQIIESRVKLTIKEYEELYKQGLFDSSELTIDVSKDRSQFVLTGRFNDKLTYRDQVNDINF